MIRPPQRAALLACAWVSAAAHASACELRLIEHRTDALKATLLVPTAQLFSISFEHSVLATTVRDRFAICRNEVWLVEEEFAGDGYGLPSTTTPDHVITTLPDGRRRLQTRRLVSPLVIRPSEAQRTRIGIAQTTTALAPFTTQALRLEPHHCDCP